MKNKNAIRITIRDTTVGFIGWVAFDNLYFLTIFIVGGYSLLYSKPGLSILLLGLPTLVVPVIYFARKHTLVGFGIVAAILINMGLWISFGMNNGGLLSMRVLELIEALLLPFPIGLILYMG